MVEVGGEHLTLPSNSADRCSHQRQGLEQRMVEKTSAKGGLDSLWFVGKRWRGDAGVCKWSETTGARRGWAKGRGLLVPRRSKALNCIIKVASSSEPVVAR